MPSHHVPVLLPEALQYLNLDRDGTYVDGTAGGGGHSRAIVAALTGKGQLLSIDRDPLATAELAKEASVVTHWHVRTGRYSQAPEFISELGWAGVDGMLLDLGLSSTQLDDGTRGFAFRKNAPLDLRFDQTSGETAADWLATITEANLSDVLYHYGDLHDSRRLAQRIVLMREHTTLRTTDDLIKAAGLSHPRRLAQLFQAIRIATNDELIELKEALPKVWQVIKPGGRVAIITFHSLEDRLVKTQFRAWADANEGVLVTKKPIAPSEDEIDRNKRARSAKLRVIEKSKN